ncbi:hypothetical protein EMCRGX_G010594 [Ephydatia muelleri]|eukprot:Em0003g1847a
MSEAGVTAGAAAQATELRKHEANDVKCSELGWLCIPLVVESYGAWGKEAMESFSSLASRLAITSSRPKSAVLSELYGRLNLNLVRANTPWVTMLLLVKVEATQIIRHNSLRDTFWESCKLACIAGQIEAGSGLDVEGSRTRPADILLPNWEFGKPAALDFTITSALNPSTLIEASVMAGSAASARKHVANDEKCSRLGWVCIPLSVETYGCWGEEAGRCLDRLATRIATRTGCPKSSAVSGLYGRLSIGLVRANARALLARSSSLS